MKKQIFTFILITVIAVRPILFIGIVGNYSLNLNEIIEKYCVNKNKPKLQCNGKCHLSKQLNVVSSSKKESSSNKIEFTLTIPIVYFQRIEHLDFSSVSNILKNFTDRYNDLYGFNYLKAIDYPPQFS